MKYSSVVKFWLVLGCVLLFFQIFIGGVTRITGSGLSITEWEIVTGTLPPMSKKGWTEEFDAYKETPQYLKINRDMEMGSIFTPGTFKFIYFWEYLHRLWARMMGFIFLFPFIFFVAMKYIDRKMIKQLLMVFFGAMLAAVFGWLMVASGLKERPWVNAYNLTLHLGIALMTMGFLVWATYLAFDEDWITNNKYFKGLTRKFFIVLLIQIFFGAIVSGMRASLYYPTWPDIGGSYLPEILLDLEYWRLQNIIDYDKSPFMPALIHFLHRNWGYLTYAFGIYYVIKIFRYPFKRPIYVNNVLLVVFLNLQVLLGILTLLYSSKSVPVFFGVMHQAVAIFLFCTALFNIYVFRRNPM